MNDKWLSRGSWQQPAVSYFLGQGYTVGQIAEKLPRLLRQYAEDGYSITDGPPIRVRRPETDLDRGFSLDCLEP